jgi:hypothetical protein
MNLLRAGWGLILLLLTFQSPGQSPSYPRNYFRHPLNVPMQLVANFGELRANHWHMGLDIRTQQRENLPVYAAAEGYISHISIEPGGFGRAIYITHPNGYTTLYAHLNNFEPRLHAWVKEQQYRAETWAIDLDLTPDLFPVSKGSFIAYSGNTGGSAGPHVHFEIRDTYTDNCLNPLLFGFPIPDAVPPTLTRLAMYDRNKSVFHQAPQLMAVRKTGASYTLARPGVLAVGSNKISFGLTATDRFSGSSNPNGIYSAHLYLDGALVSGFTLDDIDYNETRYLNAHTDYRYKAAGGPWLQHLSPMPGDTTDVYETGNEDGVIYLRDTGIHTIRIVVRDANKNVSTVNFPIRYAPSLARDYGAFTDERFIPQHVNAFERNDFELFTSELAMYDTVQVNYIQNNTMPDGAISPAHTFLNATIPTHDSVRVRIRPTVTLSPEQRDKVIIRNISGTKTVVEKVTWMNGFASAKFRQFGIYQAFIDDVPPTVNAPGSGDTINLTRATRIVFTPRDNFNAVRNFRVQVDGQWLLFTNDKGRTWIYTFDAKFPKGVHELTVTAEDEAGNTLRKSWWCRR